MEWTQLLHPTAPGLLLAAAAIVAGAPLFSGGIRAVRLRNYFRRLHEVPLDEAPGGFAHVRGKVVLDSPMFGPLSSTPCAGFELEVHARGLSLVRSVREHRRFRLEAKGASAVVSAGRGTWAVAASGDREVAAAAPLTEGLQTLLARIPESLWWRRAGGALGLVEHALVAGAECHVVGSVRPMSAAPAAVEWVRTGTDDAPTAIPATADPAPELWIGHDDHLDFLWVGDRAPRPEDLKVPRARALGVLLGPALSLAGMFYLASAADYLRALGRF